MYLRKLDREIKNHIINSYGKKCMKDREIKISNRDNKIKLTFPDIEEVLEYKLNIKEDMSSI